MSDMANPKPPTPWKALHIPPSKFAPGEGDLDHGWNEAVAACVEAFEGKEP